MTEKRYFLHKHLIKNDVIHDNICHKWLKGEELENDMNTLYNKYSSLKRENEQLKKQIGNLEHTRDFCADVCADCKRLEKENEQLKQQIKDMKIRFKQKYDHEFDEIVDELW